jgi:KRAB domain-containing zinc finger protein
MRVSSSNCFILSSAGYNLPNKRVHHQSMNRIVKPVPGQSSSTFVTLPNSEKEHHHHFSCKEKESPSSHTTMLKTVQDFECPTCNSIFPCAMTLKVHSQEHGLPNVKQFRPNDLSKTNFDTNPKHNQLLSITYNCQICQIDKPFSTKELLIAHSNTIHLQGHKCQSEECQRLYGILHKPSSASSNSSQKPASSNQYQNQISSVQDVKRDNKKSRANKADKNNNNFEILKKLKPQEANNNNNNNKVPISVHKIKKRKRYQCNQCKKILSSQISLTEHARIHSGERPYTCVVCHKSYAVKNTFRQHMAAHSGIIKEANNQEQQRISFRFRICNAIFKRKRLLSRHYLSSHNNGESGFICSYCGEIFPDEHFCEIHTQVHFSREIKKAFLDCRVCGRTFPGRDLFENHSCRFNAAMTI